MSATMQETRAATYEFEVAIDAPRDAVWTALTDETDVWWLPDFHVMGEGSVVNFDATAGGQLIERRADGGSLLWYTVQMCSPGQSLHLVGHVAPEWGGPLCSLFKLALEDRGDGCVLRVTDAMFGAIDEAKVAGQEQGWVQLFTDGLKAYAER